MGRWLKKLENQPKPLLTKLTKLNAVSFVSTASEHTQKNNAKKIDLFDFVSSCCIEHKVGPQQLIDLMLSVEDEQDIINGIIPAESLRLAIQLWITNGATRISGKNS